MPKWVTSLTHLKQGVVQAIEDRRCSMEGHPVSSVTGWKEEVTQPER